MSAMVPASVEAAYGLGTKGEAAREVGSTPVSNASLEAVKQDLKSWSSLLSMLLVVTRERACQIPDDSLVHTIDGWILGQNP